MTFTSSSRRLHLPSHCSSHPTPQRPSHRSSKYSSPRPAKCSPHPFSHSPLTKRSRFAVPKKVAKIEPFDIKNGRWEKWEKLTFLRGLRRYGKGKWKNISQLIPTRTTVQVKTHAQFILKKMSEGVDVFSPLSFSEEQQSTPCLGSQQTSSSAYKAPFKMIHMTPEMKDLEAAQILAIIASARPSTNP